MLLADTYGPPIVTLGVMVASPTIGAWAGQRLMGGKAEWTTILVSPALKTAAFR